MNCLDCQAVLQSRLDSQPTVETAELERHLSACGPCREQHAAALRLLEGLKEARPPLPSPRLAERIVGRLLEDRRRRLRRVRVRMVVTVGLAASLVVMVLSSYFLGPRITEPDVKPEGQRVQNEKSGQGEAAPEIAKSMDDARNAVVSLTERLADQTTQHAKLLLAAANPMEAAPAVPLPEAPAGIPAALGLGRAGGFAEGLEPVTRSTRRAVAFFVQEITAFNTREN